MSLYELLRVERIDIDPPEYENGWQGDDVRMQIVRMPSIFTLGFVSYYAHYMPGHEPNTGHPAFLRPIIARLPDYVQAELAKGPLAEHEDPRTNCRVCLALCAGGAFDWDTLAKENPRANRAAWRLHEYHNPDGETHGELVYERCCDIYHAAGWDGV